MDQDRRGRRTAPSVVLVAAAILATTLVVVVPGAASAATISAAWGAKVGSAGANGTATLQAYTTGTGALALKLAKLPASSSMAVTIYKGTCGSVGAVLVKLPLIRTTSAGKAARTSSLTASQVRVISNATAGTGRIAIRIGTGRTAKCGLFAASAVAPYVAAGVTVGSHPGGVVIAPSGVWITSWWENTLARIDPSTNHVLQTLPLQLTLQDGVDAIAWGAGSLWVTVMREDASGNSAPGSLLRVDAATGQVLATVPVGREPADVAVAGNTVWVTTYDDGSLTRIDAATNTVAATLPVCPKPIGVVSAFGSTWVSCDEGRVVRVDPATNSVVTTIQTQENGGFIAASPTAIWVTNAGHMDAADGSATRIDPTSNSVVANVTVGSYPQRIAYAAGSLWIGLYDVASVVRVNATTNTVMARITVSAPVTGIAATDRMVWAAHRAVGVTSTGTSGRLTRINYSGMAQGPMETPRFPPSSPPPPTASPVPSASPPASPGTGGTLYADTYVMLALPPGWGPSVAGSDPGTTRFVGPGGQALAMSSSATAMSLDTLTALAIATAKANLGIDPEANDAITIGGAPGRMLTFHENSGAVGVFMLQAVTVHNGRGYIFLYGNWAGTESADRALFVTILNSVSFMSAG